MTTHRTAVIATKPTSQCSAALSRKSKKRSSTAARRAPETRMITNKLTGHGATRRLQHIGLYEFLDLVVCRRHRQQAQTGSSTDQWRCLEHFAPGAGAPVFNGRRLRNRCAGGPARPRSMLACCMRDGYNHPVSTSLPNAPTSFSRPLLTCAALQACDRTLQSGSPLTPHQKKCVVAFAHSDFEPAGMSYCSARSTLAKLSKPLVGVTRQLPLFPSGTRFTFC